MVVKLEGKIDGRTIILNHKNGDVWETTIPKSLSGVYIVELTAYDEAGNKGYATKYLVTINPGSLKAQIQRFEWQCRLIEPIVSEVEAKLSEYVSQVIGWG